MGGFPRKDSPSCFLPRSWPSTKVKAKGSQGNTGLRPAKPIRNESTIGGAFTHMLALRCFMIFPDLSGTYSVYLPKVFTPRFCHLSFCHIRNAIDAVVFELFHFHGLVAPVSDKPESSPWFGPYHSLPKGQGSHCYIFLVT